MSSSLHGAVGAVSSRVLVSQRPHFGQMRNGVPQPAPPDSSASDSIHRLSPRGALQRAHFLGFWISYDPRSIFVVTQHSRSDWGSPEVERLLSS